MASKVKFTAQAQEMAGTFVRMADNVAAWRDVYWDRTYNDGGANELTDADVESLGVTAADVAGMTTFADALDTFMMANRAYLSKMRNDL